MLTYTKNCGCFSLDELDKKIPLIRRERRISTWAGVMVLTVLVLGTALMPHAALAQTTNTRYFAYEYTSQGGQFLQFYNPTDAGHTVTVDIYYPRGALWGTESVVLRAYENITITNPNDTWGLPDTDQGTAVNDTAYGLVATSDQLFSIITASDRIQVGTGAGTIHPQGNLYTDSWWGMYNYPSGGDVTKEDYFFIFNPNGSSTAVTFTVYDSAGVEIGTRQKGSRSSIPFNAYQTQKIYPQRDLGVAANRQNIGVHMTATQGVAVNVSTNLGSSWNFTGGPYTTHDDVTGAYVPLSTDDCGTSYVWTNARASDAMAAVRVTNITGSSTDVTWTIYTWDGTGPVGGNSYQVVQIVPAYGTAELPPPDTNDFGNENVSSPWFHSCKLESTAPIATHVSLEENIVTPVIPGEGWTRFWWGGEDPSQSRQYFLINPSGQTITIHSEAWCWTGDYHETGDDITLGAYDALATNATDTGTGPGFHSEHDKVFHFHSDDHFAVLLQDAIYGDVTPLVGGFYDTPVELSSFAAMNVDDGVRLEWVTQSESDNLGFNVYRSGSSGGTYHRMNPELVPGAGTTMESHEYSYLDEEVEAGTTYYYKLADVSTGGVQNLHGPIRVDVVVPTQSFLLDASVPNPVMETADLRYHLPSTGRARLSLYNVTGRVVRVLVDDTVDAGSHTVRLNRDDDQGRLPAGLYLLRLLCPEGERSRRIVVAD